MGHHYHRLRMNIVYIIGIFSGLRCGEAFISSLCRRPDVHFSTLTLGAAGDEVALTLHHTAIKTRNITLALQFYSLLGFEATEKFRAGPAKAAWLEQRSSPGNGRLELIEVPSYMLNEPEGMKRQAIDLARQRQDLLGHNHLALDVTESMKSLGIKTLKEWIGVLNQRSVDTFGKNLRIAVEPMQQMIGNGVFELAFLYDADGALIELLHKQTVLPQKISSGWEPQITNTDVQ